MKVKIIKKENIDIEEQLNILKDENIEVSDINFDYVIAFGGDGTILKTKEYTVPILAVNFGKLGYMAEIEAKNFRESLIILKNKEFNISRRYLLECKLDDKIYYALNEIVFKYDVMGEIEVFDDKHRVSSFRADGLIISTSTGSTAYAMSAGGSIIHPDVKALNIVAISPQYLGARPIILPDIRLKVKSESNIYIDGINIGKCKEVFVRYSSRYIKIIEQKEKNYYDVLKSKLDWR